jgi:hypothetical protein
MSARVTRYFVDGKPLPRASNEAIAAVVSVRERPECDHEKQPVEVEIIPGADYLPGTRLLRKGWYCPTCRREYAQVTN